MHSVKILWVSSILLMGASTASAQGEDLDFLFDDAPAQDASKESSNGSGSTGSGTASPSSGQGETSTPGPTREEAAPQADASASPPAAEQEAQREPPGTAARGSGSRLVEEIIVTAQKREENLSDVPISVSAFSAEKLDALAVTDTGDLPRLTPGLTINNRIGLATTFLRGVGSNAFLLGDPLVVTYIDNIYFPFAGGQVQNLGAVEQVEVLKGPQGTLFGRNALGGAIKIDSADPSLEDRQFSAQTVYSGRYGKTNTRAYASTPLTDGLAVNLSGYYTAGDNIADGTLDDAGQRRGLIRNRSSGYRAKLLWEPVDDFRAKLGIFQVNQSGFSPYAVNTDPSAIGEALGIEPGDPYNGVNNDVPPEINNDTLTYFANLEYESRWLDARLYGSDQEVEFFSAYDFDGSVQPSAAFSSVGTADVQTAELQFLSNDSAPDWLRGIVGVYYFQAVNAFRDATLRGGSVDLTEGTLGGVAVPAPLVDLLRSGATQLPVQQGTIGLDGELGTDSIAYFFQTTLDVTDWFGLTLGARYQVEDRIVLESVSGLRDDRDGSYAVEFQRFDGRNDPDLRDTTRAFDPKVSLNFRPGWGWLGSEPLLYASYQTATTSSTFNSLNVTDAPERVEATEITAYEVGLKTQLFSGLMDFSAAAFHYDIDNPQVQIISLLAGGALSFENAESQRIQGAEFDTTVQLLPALIDNLVVTASASYLDAIYTSFPQGSGFDPDTGVFMEDAFNFTGNQIAGAPKYSGSLGLLKTFSVPGGPLEVGVNGYFRDEVFALAQNSPESRIDAYQTLGLNISYLYRPLGLRIAAFGTNVLNERYKVARFVTDFGPNDNIAPLSEYGLRLRYEY